MSTGANKPKACLADGDPSQLLIASDNKLRRLSPFKAGDISDSVFSPGSIRIEAADIYYNATEVSFNIRLRQFYLSTEYILKMSNFIIAYRFLE